MDDLQVKSETWSWWVKSILPILHLISRSRSFLSRPERPGRRVWRIRMLFVVGIGDEE